MVRSYNEYLRLLESAVICNGKYELSDVQIDQFIRTNNLDFDWQIISSEVRKDMMLIVRRLGQLQPTVSPKPAPRTNSRRLNHSIKKVKNYSDYIKLLDSFIVHNGKKELSAVQINEFIRVNNLYSDWGIVLTEVKKDMATILGRYKTPVGNAPKPSNSASGQYPARNINGNNSSARKKIKSYVAYMQLLEIAMLNNGKKELNDVMVAQFLSVNKLDSEWGISAVEIRKDMKTIASKFGRQARTDTLKTKYTSSASTPNTGKTSKPIALAKPKKQSRLNDDDKKIVTLLRDVLRNYPDIIQDSRRLRGAIADILPEKKREVNLLGTLIEKNIITVIKTNNSLDTVLCDRFACILEEEYGTSMELARRMVLICFHAYGGLILDRIID